MWGICETCVNEGYCKLSMFDCNPDNMFKEYRYERRTEEDDYATLKKVLDHAAAQSSSGKGKERHANDNKYEDQVICVVQRLLKDHPFGGHAYQIIKKTIEAGRLYKIKGAEAAYQEMLGVINYCAAMGILMKEEE